MKCLIVINPFSTNMAAIAKARRLKEEAIKRGVMADIKGTCDLPVMFKDSTARVEGGQGYDFCLYLDKDKYIGEVLSLSMPVFNSPKATEWCDDKSVTYMESLGIGVKTPLTIPAPLNYADSPSEAEVEKFLDFVEKSLGYPLVCKEAYGSLGKQVYLIRNRKELAEKYHQLEKTTHLYQEFIGESTHYGTDYRVITIGGKAVAAMKRVNDTDFRSNVGSGGKGFPADDMPQSFARAAEAISQKLGLDFAGIDLAKGPDGSPYFYEANSNAFFSEIERVTGLNIAGMLMDYCIGKVGKSHREK